MTEGTVCAVQDCEELARITMRVTAMAAGLNGDTVPFTSTQDLCTDHARAIQGSEQGFTVSCWTADPDEGKGRE